MNVVKYLFGGLGVGVFLVVGLVSLIRPDVIRNFILEQYRQGLARVSREDLSFLLKVVPGARVFRIYGLVSLATAALIIFALWKL